MRYLLDTHALLWTLFDRTKLSKKVQGIISTSKCFYSMASLWEIGIKQSIGKLEYDASIPEIVKLCERQKLEGLTINENHIERIKTLPFIHRDPFDRLLIAQSLCEELVFISKDINIVQYRLPLVW